MTEGRVEVTVAELSMCALFNGGIPVESGVVACAQAREAGCRESLGPSPRERRGGIGAGEKRQGFGWMLDVTAGLLKVKVVVRGRGGR